LQEIILIKELDTQTSVIEIINLVSRLVF